MNGFISSFNMAGGISSNWENLFIYYANLSPVYVCSSLFTVLALFFTWWFSTSMSKEEKDGLGVCQVKRL